jgi:hypothetical protein
MVGLLDEKCPEKAPGPLLAVFFALRRENIPGFDESPRDDDIDIEMDPIGITDPSAQTSQPSSVYFP